MLDQTPTPTPPIPPEQPPFSEEPRINILPDRSTPKWWYISIGLMLLVVLVVGSLQIALHVTKSRTPKITYDQTPAKEIQPSVESINTHIYVYGRSFSEKVQNRVAITAYYLTKRFREQPKIQMQEQYFDFVDDALTFINPKMIQDECGVKKRYPDVPLTMPHIVKGNLMGFSSYTQSSWQDKNLENKFITLFIGTPKKYFVAGLHLTPVGDSFQWTRAILEQEQYTFCGNEYPPYALYSKSPEKLDFIDSAAAMNKTIQEFTKENTSFAVQVTVRHPIKHDDGSVFDNYLFDRQDMPIVDTLFFVSP